MVEADLLVHVRQRLDALTYDDHSQYLVSSLPFVSAYQPPDAVQTNRRRPTLLDSWLRYAGLTGFYVRLVLLLGTGWVLAMVGIFTFLYALPAAQEDIVLTSTAQVILLLGVYFLGGALGSLAFGVCADHYGRRPVLLSALTFWLIVNAMTSGAWNYASFVTLRLLAGAGIGGQLALLATLALEYTPTRTRGRITVLSVSIAGLGVFAGVGYGQLTSAEKGLGWRITYGVLSGIALLFLAVLYLALEESPKYLASVGRSEEALYILEKIENAHGITRQARVTVPTSLYEPPSQRPHISYERYLESSDSDSDLEMELHEDRQRERPARSSLSYKYTGPGAAKARSQSYRVSARGLQSHQVEVCTPTEDPGTPSYSLARNADLSFIRALARRVVVLFSRSMARRTVLIWFFWFAELTCFSAAIVTTLMMAGTFIKVNGIGTGFGVRDQLFWSVMTFPGLVFTAAIIETAGRRVTLALFVFFGGVVMLTSAWLLEEHGEWFGVSLALGAMVLATGGTLGALIPFTGEQFPLLTRALGISCASAWGHLGMFAGVYLVLRRVMGDEAWSWHDERLMLAGCGAVAIVLLPAILFMGPETRGRDIDASWFEDNKGLHTRAGGVLAATPANTKDVDKAFESSEKVPESPFDRGSTHVAMTPAVYSPASYSPGDCESSSGFWLPRRLGHKMKHASHAIARKSDEKIVSDSKLRASGEKRPDRCDTRRIDQAEMMHEYYQHRRSSEENPPQRRSVLEMLEPVLLDWRRSLSSSFSSSARGLSSSKEEPCASMPTDIKSKVRASETGRYTIDLDMFDTFTYISTPVLGGDNSDHEHREPSNLSSVSSGEMKQAT
ncbi:hypothetical protein PC129_g7369 [Phytophthora cactorum]|uniref:Major facilitator superfamily (MFS) profile domain-containing protein n=1 Tax=Phytophthora cactorum TaxID=29920 RepID=A0A329SJ90_9STRA|nr:hypothetical protein Pcac1_g4545 [Phytophthora cactorum]KAG2818151.1 hypothetical protein PC112_g12752 [Phytophthora cactorum]KAG2820436.1 hypothetical protein PC111_g11464 [Phytophthora cactorum]KAG2854771.1 hypothetical protein PC113_g13007 [Phytophthora cactorum]KAG2899944.1 hypothetical protein PC114_g13715 [Phytophthora cactorum]